MEKILAIPTAVINAAGLMFQGLGGNPAAFLQLIADHGIFLDRDPAEKNPKYKQIIPYFLVTRGDDVLVHSRHKGGESRLQGKLSLGIGGHINTGDLGFKVLAPDEDPPLSSLEKLSAFLVGAFREFHEEVDLTGEQRTAVMVGVINDDSTEVGSVHLGILFRLSVGPMDEITGKENEMAWLPKDELLPQMIAADISDPVDATGAVVSNPPALPSPYSRLETWSKIAVDGGVLSAVTALNEKKAACPLLTLCL